MGKLLDSDAVKEALCDAVDDISRGYTAVYGIEEDDIEGIIDSIPPAQPEPHWIPTGERMPEEHESMFSKFHGTLRWRPSMWLRQSDRVLVTSELADGTRITETATTRDGEWKPDHVILKREIVAWMPMPKPYKEDRK